MTGWSIILICIMVLSGLAH